MKLGHKILVILIITVISFYLFAEYAVNNIKVKKISLREINLAGLKNANADIAINVEIENNNFFNINVKDLYIELFYKGVLLAQSSQSNLNKINISIKANSKTTISHSFKIIINPILIELGLLINQKIPVIIGYKVGLKLYGLNLNLKGDYTHE